MNRLLTCRRFKGVDGYLGHSGESMWGRCNNECDDCVVKFTCFTTSRGDPLILSVDDYAKIRERRGFKQLLPPLININEK